MDQIFYDAVEANPVIAAVKDEEGLRRGCRSAEIGVIFILFGDICTIKGIVKEIQHAGKIAMIHMDLISGIGQKEVTVDFIREYTHADGIITTKPALIRRAKELSMYTVLRFFVIDSLALKNIAALERQPDGKPDFIEVLPGVMPKVIRKICRLSRIPVIAGGLIADREDVVGALDAGAMAVSATNYDIWKL